MTLHVTSTKNGPKSFCFVMTLEEAVAIEARLYREAFKDDTVFTLFGEMLKANLKANMIQGLISTVEDDTESNMDFSKLLRANEAFTPHDIDLAKFILATKRVPLSNPTNPASVDSE